jgi:hypothetical protein
MNANRSEQVYRSFINRIFDYNSAHLAVMPLARH